jgi:hypothetical protein
MATEDSVKSTSTRTAGGSPYLQSFIAPAEVAQTAQFERELQMDRNERERASFEAGQARALRQEEFQNKELEYRERSEDRRLEAANLAIRKQDAQDALKLQESKRETEASEVAGKIGLLNESSPTVRDDLKKLVEENANVFTSKYAKFPLEQLEAKQKGHSDYIGWLSKSAQTSGYSGDVYALPKNDRGEFDTTANGQIFGEKGVFTTAFSQKQQKEQTDTQRKLQEARDRSFMGESTSVKLPDGEVIKVEAQKPEKPIDYKKEAKEFEIKYGVPASVLQNPIGETTGSTKLVRGKIEEDRFVADPEGDFVQVKDASIKTLKKGKLVPYEVFENYKSNASGQGQSGAGMQGGTAFFPSSAPSPLPQTQPQATTDSSISPAKEIDWNKYNQ